MVQRRSRRGQNMVEFAIISPLLFLLFFGIMEFGWLLFHNHQVSNAAREGARFAVVNGAMSGDPATSASIRDYVIDRVVLANPESLDVTIDELDGDMEPESRIRVAVDYTHQTVIGMVFQGATVQLGADSTMRIHY